MVHAVLMRGVNDHEAAGLLRFCLDRGYELRFIEQMPLDAQHGWRRTDMITASEILARLSDGFSLTPDDPRGRGSAPAEMFLVNGGPARVGVIGSVTRPFCGSCDRVRLTADRQVRNRLFATTETDLRTPLPRLSRRTACGPSAGPGPAGRGKNLPGNLWPQGEVAGRDHDAWTLRLRSCPPVCPPTALDTGWRPSTSMAKRAGQRGYGRDLPPDWNCPASVRQRHTSSDLGSYLRVERQTFSLHWKRSSDR